MKTETDGTGETAAIIAASAKMIAQFHIWASKERRQMSYSADQTSIVIRETRELLHRLNRVD